MSDPDFDFFDFAEWSPGGWQAKKRGCICEAIANRWGEGAVIKGREAELLFYISPKCPLHGKFCKEQEVDSNLRTQDRGNGAESDLRGPEVGT